MTIYVFCDLDGCLADDAWRQHLIDETGWDAYHAASKDDAPHDGVMTMLRTLNTERIIVALTGRNEAWRGVTLEWLTRHGAPIHQVLMRPDKDYRPAPEVKLTLATEFFGGLEALKAQTHLVLDDRQDVVETFQELGITSLIVKPGRR